MKHFIFPLIALTALFSATPASAAGDAVAGKAKTMLCASCHGAAGVAVADMYPNLAGQNEAYLISALKAYREYQDLTASAGIEDARVKGWVMDLERRL